MCKNSLQKVGYYHSYQSTLETHLLLRHDFGFVLPLQLPAKIYEPRHEISKNVVCKTSKGSDQPAHTRSLTRAFDSGLNIL